jgi:hypothetical protein
VQPAHGPVVELLLARERALLTELTHSRLANRVLVVLLVAGIVVLGVAPLSRFALSGVATLVCAIWLGHGASMMRRLLEIEEHLARAAGPPWEAVYIQLRHSARSAPWYFRAEYSEPCLWLCAAWVAALLPELQLPELQLPSLGLSLVWRPASGAVSRGPRCARDPSPRRDAVAAP